MSPEFIQSICCLHTGSGLQLTNDQQRDRINRAIEAGAIANAMGDTIEHPIEHALVDIDFRFAYPIRQGIPTLIREEAITIDDKLGSELRKDTP